MGPVPDAFFRRQRGAEFCCLSATSVRFGDPNMESIDDYIWQRRIHRGVRHQQSALPFPESVEIGLEFNAALERKEKLDRDLLTNGVMLDLCDFAKTVTKSETYFLFEILEFNFDLGVDMNNDLQCYEYANRVHDQIKLLKDQIKLKPHRWKETFPLPDHDTVMGFTGSEQSGRYGPEMNKFMDYSVLTDGSKNSQSADPRTESNGTASCGFIRKNRGVRVTDDTYPFCKELSVTLTVDDTSKQKLDPDRVTNGVMMELLDFSRVLCGTFTGIVQELVKQNFGLELDKLQFHMDVSKLLARKNACLTAKDRDAFRKELFKVRTKNQEQNRKKRKHPDSQELELEQLTSLRHKDSDVTDIWQEIDLSYMCPIDFETDVQSGTEATPEKIKFKTCLSEMAEETLTVSLGVKQEEEEQPHDSTLSNHLPKNAALKAVSDLFSEDKHEDVNVRTLKQKLWMRRATRSKQILKSSRVNDLFARCREMGLDFNVGSGNKRNLDLQLLTNSVLCEVYRFATAMFKSVCNFLFDILETNFNLLLQDELHHRNFLFYITTKERILQNHPDRQKMEFLSSPFRFPEAYTMVGATGDFQTAQETETDWNSPASSTNPQKDSERHPFCDKLGLNLWSAERPASQRLDLTVLTTGAVLEVLRFVRELCGTVRGTVSDVLEHNFDLDLQSGVTEAAQVIRRWYVTQKSMMKRPYTSPNVKRWLNRVVPLSGRSQLDPPTANCLDDSEPGKETGAFDGNMQQVNKCHYSCEQIGLDLVIGSEPEAKTKLDLRMLTRGVLFEMHQYVRRNSKRYVPALYEILEYNFDLSSQRHRKVEFAWSIASQVLAIAGKTGRTGDYLNKVFELPFVSSETSSIVCKEEPEDSFGEPDLNDNSDMAFVRELKPVDIEVEIE